MGKISPISAKYIIRILINANGIVDKPDVIGAIFGQTEGLLGTELELRELQKNGRIGRIEVNIETKGGKSTGEIIIPSSLDMAETAVVASSIETIQRIGPCNAKLKIKDIEDVRVTKRNYVVERAKELLKEMIEKGPESGELMEEIKESVRALEIVEYGPEKLPAGPGLNDSEEIIVVEGRADVITLLKNGFRNVIGLNGTTIPQSVVNLAKQKTTTIFVDGDRGGILIVKGFAEVSDIDFVARAPSGKEVEELTKKEINKCLRARVPLEQFLEEVGETITSAGASQQNISPVAPFVQQIYPVNVERTEDVERQEKYNAQRTEKRMMNRYNERRREQRLDRRHGLNPEVASQFRKMLDELTGTRGAYLLDENFNVLGKVPVKELPPTLANLAGVNTIIMDGSVDAELIGVAESARVKQIIANEAEARGRFIKIFTAEELNQQA